MCFRPMNIYICYELYNEREILSLKIDFNTNNILYLVKFLINWFIT